MLIAFPEPGDDSRVFIVQRIQKIHSKVERWSVMKKGSEITPSETTTKAPLTLK